MLWHYCRACRKSHRSPGTVLKHEKEQHILISEHQAEWRGFRVGSKDGLCWRQSMTVETIKVYKCNNCGKRGRWSDSWSHKIVFHKQGRTPLSWWEETIHVCSDACRDEYDKKHNTKLTTPKDVVE